MGSIEDYIKQYALEKGANVVGIASADEYNRHAPEGHRPGDLLRGAKSIIVVGFTRYTSGQWRTSSTEVIHRARSSMGSRDSLAVEMALLIEKKFGYHSISINAHMNDTGLNVPISLKLCAELAGLGTRSMAGGIILNQKYGLLGFSATITTMSLKPDGPLAKPVCPSESCILSWEKKRTTPCMEICSAIDGKIKNGKLEEVIYYRQLCATRALTTMNAAYLRLIPEIIAQDNWESAKYLAIGQARMSAEDPPGRGIWGRCIECMRICPVNTKANQLTREVE